MSDKDHYIDGTVLVRGKRVPARGLVVNGSLRWVFRDLWNQYSQSLKSTQCGKAVASTFKETP